MRATDEYRLRHPNSNSNSNSNANANAGWWVGHADPYRHSDPNPRDEHRDGHANGERVTVTQCLSFANSKRDIDRDAHALGNLEPDHVADADKYGVVNDEYPERDANAAAEQCWRAQSGCDEWGNHGRADGAARLGGWHTRDRVLFASLRAAHCDRAPTRRRPGSDCEQLL